MNTDRGPDSTKIPTYRSKSPYLSYFFDNASTYFSSERSHDQSFKSDIENSFPCSVSNFSVSNVLNAT